MRICHVVRQYYPSVGGLETFVASLAESLTDLGCDNEILTLDRLFYDGGRSLLSSEVVRGIRVHRVSMIGHPRFFIPLIDPAALHHYDVIHVHGIDGMFDRLSRQRRAPHQVLTATSHGLFFHTPWMAPVKKIYLRTATRMAARQYDFIIANSISDLRRLRKVTRDVVHLPNGVSPLGDFEASGADLLCLGRLARHKHVERIVAALAERALAGVNLHVVGPEWDVTQLEIAKIAERHGVGERVKLHGRVDAATLARIARQCGVFVSASTYEGFGMSLIEAMSVGLAPVVHPNDAFLELLEASKCGSVTDFKHPDQASHAIRRELDGLDEKQRRQAIDFSARFSWRGHAERTLELYQRARREAVAAA
jgi:alpha-1,3-mannosyltransferase